MDTLVPLRLRDDVAVATMTSPPGNALVPALRQALWQMLDELEAMTAARALVLVAEGATFSSGSDVREGGDGPGAPTLGSLCQRLEALAIPVVAGLHGLVLGGGAELALAAHYRLAAGKTRIGFPEVTLGLVPGAGATQRLPRLIGAPAALDLLLSGRTLPSEPGRRVGLLDGVVDGHLPSGAITFARTLIEKGTGPRPASARREQLADGSAHMAAVAQARQAVVSAAGHGIVDCVEAALLLPFTAGLEFESAARETCRASPEPAALTHMFLAERRIAPRLLQHEAEAPPALTEDGKEVVERLADAAEEAVAHLLREGWDIAEIDAAMTEVGLGDAPASWPDLGGSEPQRRLIAALMAEGSRLVERRVVERPADIDVLAVHGMGFPRRWGGPMRAAQTLGLLRLKRDMDRWAQDDPVWAPSVVLIQAVKFAGGFDEVVLAPAAKVG